MRGRWRQPSSRWVGFAVAGAYVVITAITGTALLVAGQRISAADAQKGPSAGAFAQYTDTITVTKDPRKIPDATTTTRPSTSTVTTRVTEPAPPSQPTSSPTRPPARHASTPGYEQVTGPGGLRTVIPQDWSRARSTGPGAEVAVDPDNALRYVKFGGAAAPDEDMAAAHVLYETSYAARSTGYRRITLSTATFHGDEAVVWEFRFSGPGGTQHAKSLYWRDDGTEYFVLVSGPEGDWGRMSSIYRQMVASARP